MKYGVVWALVGMFAMAYFTPLAQAQEGCFDLEPTSSLAAGREEHLASALYKIYIIPGRGIPDTYCFMAKFKPKYANYVN